ncbi:MAG: twin-arginine translocase TatA/TatE family subunit [Proteobacteria bacterium]|nr:twin-arginine translocase TatA/TatE family subunit [Cystobacterineae bacterium]MCL2259591.1 twin-arginine translocase TatA/TatE family subunit [Cystobacterineae bacterium]MCL2313902.1 twin-arginine translocase TatA/TatE family subunit [Pseudomonadota bacterium]
MLNIGTGEMLLICVAALLLLGPKRLPKMARSIGRFWRNFRRQADSVRGLVEREFLRMDLEDNNKAALEAMSAPKPKDEPPAEPLATTPVATLPYALDDSVSVTPPPLPALDDSLSPTTAFPTLGAAAVATPPLAPETVAASDSAAVPATTPLPALDTATILAAATLVFDDDTPTDPGPIATLAAASSPSAAAIFPSSKGLPPKPFEKETRKKKGSKV